jgi:penicillin-insensitive murein endopeptidase
VSSTRSARAAFFAGAGLALTACLGTPTPLAPAVSGSVGMPYNGVQTHPMELPVSGPGFTRFRPRGAHYWANPRLIRAIEQASANVLEKAPGGAPLLVGDFSAERGGKITGHRSHRNGRDVDLLFFVTTPAGAPIRNPGFVPFDSDGLGFVNGGEPGRYLRLDLEREWLLVKELLFSAEIGVQFMFVSRDIEALLIDYARARGEPPELVFHAETVLLQPGDSTAHDDHVHLRIACTPDEAVTGCEGGGPLWDWLPAERSLGPLDALELGRIAEDDPLDPEPAMQVTGGPAVDPGPPKLPGGGA